MKRFRDTPVFAGKTDPKMSVIDFPTMQGFGNSPFILNAGMSFVFHVLTFDRFRNQILENRVETDKLEGIVIPSLKAIEDYNITESRYLGNGTFLVEVIVIKIGEISNLNMTLNGERLSWSELEKRNAPLKLRIHPNGCSSTRPNILNKNLLTAPVVSGLTSKFFIDCLDRYGNPVEGGYENFEVSIISFNLTTVGSDKIVTEVFDHQNGTYEVRFRVAWEGEYIVNIARESQP